MSDFNPNNSDKYGMASKSPTTGTEARKASAILVVMLAIFVAVGLVIFYSTGTKDYTVNHSDIALSPSSTSNDIPGNGATTPLPALLPNVGRPAPLQSPPLATPSEPQK
jgi:hypothetical protein